MQRIKVKANLVEATLHPIITNLISANDSNELYVSSISSEITGVTAKGTKEPAIEGYYDNKKPNEYQSADYGTCWSL
jgi:hypothetical protein